MQKDFFGFSAICSCLLVLKFGGQYYKILQVSKPWSTESFLGSFGRVFALVELRSISSYDPLESHFKSFESYFGYNFNLQNGKILSNWPLGLLCNCNLIW